MITTHTAGHAGPRYAAINVKVRPIGQVNIAALARQVAEQNGGDHPRLAPFNAAWIDTLAEEQRHAAFEDACDRGWELADEDAQDIFGEAYGVTSEGRSGGWLLVTYKDRPCFDEEAIAEWSTAERLAWETFEGRVVATVGDTWHRYVDTLYRHYWAEGEAVDRLSDPVCF